MLELGKELPVEQFEASRAIRGSSISVNSTLSPCKVHRRERQDSAAHRDSRCPRAVGALLRPRGGGRPPGARRPGQAGHGQPAVVRPALQGALDIYIYIYIYVYTHLLMYLYAYVHTYVYMYSYPVVVATIKHYHEDSPSRSSGAHRPSASRCRPAATCATCRRSPGS